VQHAVYHSRRFGDRVAAVPLDDQVGRSVDVRNNDARLFDPVNIAA